jgi:hypothetical protein
MADRDRGGGAELGQASVELIAAVPVLLLTALVCLQLLVAGYALTLASGAPADDAARGALPGWARTRVEVTARDGAVSVRLQPPTVVPGLGDLLAVSSQAHVREPG